jgi:hypothetical protein
MRTKFLLENLSGKLKKMEADKRYAGMDGGTAHFVSDGVQ